LQRASDPFRIGLGARVGAARLRDGVVRRLDVSAGRELREITRDVDDRVHARIRRLCEHAARALDVRLLHAGDGGRISVGEESCRMHHGIAAAERRLHGGCVGDVTKREFDRIDADAEGRECLCELRRRAHQCADDEVFRLAQQRGNRVHTDEAGGTRDEDAARGHG